MPGWGRSGWARRWGDRCGGTAGCMGEVVVWGWQGKVYGVRVSFAPTPTDERVAS